MLKLNDYMEIGINGKDLFFAESIAINVPDYVDDSNIKDYNFMLDGIIYVARSKECFKGFLNLVTDTTYTMEELAEKLKYKELTYNENCITKATSKSNYMLSDLKAINPYDMKINPLSTYWDRRKDEFYTKEFKNSHFENRVIKFSQKGGKYREYKCIKTFDTFEVGKIYPALHECSDRKIYFNHRNGSDNCFNHDMLLKDVSEYFVEIL